MTREKSIECAGRWNKEHADRVRNRARASYKVNVEKLRKTKREIRLKLLRHLGDRCVFCGYDKNELALQIDHINEVAPLIKGDLKETLQLTDTI